MIDKEHILSIFRDSNGLLEGHFQLTSGLHSDRYFQCALVLQHPDYTELLCAEIAHQFRPVSVDVVIAPALGGIVVSQEVGRQLHARTIFAERKDGIMQLRRGFRIGSGERVLVCEDVVTTGASVTEVINIVTQCGAKAIGAACVVDRSGGRVKFALEPGGLQYSLVQMEAVAYNPDECPLCAQGLPFVKPGSRSIA